MPRQVVSAIKVLPPFEIVDFQKTILVAVKTPDGEILSIEIPVSIFEDENKFVTAARQDISDILDSAVMVKATKLELVEITKENK